MFSNDQLQKLVSETLPVVTSPEGHQNALVGTVNDEGVQVVVALKRNTEHASWEVQGGYKHTWDGDNQAGAKVLVTW
jgi:flagellar hook assembly protein FlgD